MNHFHTPPRFIIIIIYNIYIDILGILFLYVSIQNYLGINVEKHNTQFVLIIQV